MAKRDLHYLVCKRNKPSQIAWTETTISPYNTSAVVLSLFLMMYLWAIFCPSSIPGLYTPGSSTSTIIRNAFIIVCLSLNFIVKTPKKFVYPLEKFLCCMHLHFVSQQVCVVSTQSRTILKLAAELKLRTVHTFSNPKSVRTSHAKLSREMICFIIMGDPRLRAAHASQVPCHCWSSSDTFALRVSCAWTPGHFAVWHQQNSQTTGKVALTRSLEACDGLRAFCCL